MAVVAASTEPQQLQQNIGQVLRVLNMQATVRKTVQADRRISLICKKHHGRENINIQSSLLSTHTAVDS